MMIPLNSSAISAVGWDDYHLFVQFHTSDTIYTFYGVPYSIFAGLVQADSPGTFYHRHIEGRYRG